MLGAPEVSRQVSYLALPVMSTGFSSRFHGKELPRVSQQAQVTPGSRLDFRRV